MVRGRSTTLDLHSSLRESGSYFQNAEGVRFLRAELQTALTSRLLGHIRTDFTPGTMLIHILQILVRFWKSTWIFAWYLSFTRIVHPAYQKFQNCVGNPKIVFLAPYNLEKRQKPPFCKFEILSLTEYRAPLILKTTPCIDRIYRYTRLHEVVETWCILVRMKNTSFKRAFTQHRNLFLFSTSILSHFCHDLVPGTFWHFYNLSLCGRPHQSRPDILECL